MIDRAHVPSVLVSVGGITALIGTFLPWVRSGAIDRSSYDTFEMVERLGFSPDGPIGWALRLWPLVPLLVVLTIVAWWWPRPGRRLAKMRLVSLPVVALYPLGTALAVQLAPDAGLLRIGPGPLVTLIGIVVLATGPVSYVLTSTRADRSAHP